MKHLSYCVGQFCHGHDSFVYTFVPKVRALVNFMLVLIVIGTVDLAYGRVPTEGDFIAATQTAEEIGDLFDKMPKRPSSVAVFGVTVNAPLDPSFGGVVESEITRHLRETASITFINCFECRSPRMEVRGDKLIVKKGAPDQAALTELGKSLGVDSFLVLDVYRTKFTMVTQATLYQASDGQVLTSKQIKVPALDWTDAGMQILLTIGPASVSGGKSVSSSDSFHIATSFSFFEEVGFGKAGLAFGTRSGPKGSLTFLNPTVGWRGRWGSYGVYSLKTIGMGFGVSDGIGGITPRVSYDLFLGTFTMVGIDAMTLVSLQDAGNRKPVGFSASAYIGFAIGR